jgi:hypothetical protein
MRRSLVAAAAALVAAAVAVGVGSGGTTTSDSSGTMVLNGQKVFPIVLAKGPDAGATAPDGAKAFAEVARAGVNFLKLGPATTPWTSADISDANAQDRAAAANGLATWVNLSTVAQATPGSAGDTLLQQVVTSLESDPGGSAIGAWKGADEPLWSGLAPAALRFAYCRATGRGDSSWCAGESVLDSQHQWVTIEAPRGTAAQLQPYTAVTDIHGVDVYPVTLQNPSPNLHDVGVWTSTVASVTPSQAVWTTLQVCASGSYDASGHYVLPTFAQERYMAYDAIVNGARSLAFYGGNIAGCWNASDRQLGWNWTFWSNALKPLIAELNASSPLAPALVDPASNRVLTTSDSSTQAISRSGDGSDLWVIATRSGPGSVPVTIGGLPSGVSSGSVYTEDRAVSVASGAFTDDFPQWGVHVYHFTVGPPAPPPPTTTPQPPAQAPGGGGSAPDLAVTMTPSATAVQQGLPVDVSVLVRNSGAAGSLRTHLAIALPPALELVAAPHYERGSGCTGTQQIDCFLDYVPNDSETHVAFEVNTVAPGSATIAATATADRDSDAGNNTANITIDVAAPATPTATAPTPRVAPRTFSGTAGADRLTGTAGADLIYGRNGNDTLVGGRGNDILNGGRGNDLLDGGPGLDRLYGGPGNDTLRARDGHRDVVDCGPGRDLARVDRADSVSGCETIIRR